MMNFADAWYSILPFAHPDPRDPVGGYGHGLMSADQPWSGHYRVMPPLYMLAHTTQLVRPGVCKYVDSASVLKGGLRKYITHPIAQRDFQGGFLDIACEYSKRSRHEGPIV